VPEKDARLVLGSERLPLSPRNANTMWILHFLHHLAESGTAGFVMATGELSSGENSRLAVRRALVDQGYVDCIVQLSGQLFANTQIPCGLWFLSKNRSGSHGYRKRSDEILFLDGRKLGTLIPGSRKQKQLSEEEIERIASVYRGYKREKVPEPVPGFCKVATLAEVRAHEYALAPGRYVGSSDVNDDDEPFEEKFPRLVKGLEEQFARSRILEEAVVQQLGKVGAPDE
jgi:type I restriction enzyme M protein